MNDIETSILKTLIFFDMFNYPLTLTELWKWLYQAPRKVDIDELQRIMETSPVINAEVQLVEAFYCLHNRDNIIYLRKQNNNLAERKFFKAIRLLRFYRFIPYIRMVAICNSLAYSNAKKDSDIDLFIIASRGKIWLARFFAVLIVRLLASRPTKDKHQDAFCLSFFIDESELNIENIKLGKDIYLPYWLAQLMPIYDQADVYAKFIQANAWHKKVLVNSYPNQFSKAIKNRRWTKIIAKIIGFIVSPPLLNRFSDDIYRSVQVPIISRNLRSLVNIDTRVVVNESMLKFHDNDRREYFYKKWKTQVNQLLDKYEKEVTKII